MIQLGQTISKSPSLMYVSGTFLFFISFDISPKFSLITSLRFKPILGPAISITVVVAVLGGILRILIEVAFVITFGVSGVYGGIVDFVAGGHFSLFPR